MINTSQWQSIIAEWIAAATEWQGAMRDHVYNVITDEELWTAELRLVNIESLKEDVLGMCR